MADLHLQLVRQLQGFLDDVSTRSAHISYSHGRHKHIPALSTPAADAAFCFASIKDYTSGAASSALHCDGGPSTIFLAITISGERLLDMECVHPDTGALLETKTVHCVPGHVYLSSPSCFWHAVRAVPSPSSSGPQRTLILRSDCMNWRLSGGKLSRSGTGRTPGFVYGTSTAFEQFALVVSDAIMRLPRFSLQFV